MINRQQRRAAERKARKAGHSRPNMTMWLCDGSPIPNDIKVDIFRIVHGVQFTGLDGGTCLFRNAVGHLALWMLGWEPQLCIGGCLYRAGPDLVRDTLSFCGPGNTGQIFNGVFVGHAWLVLAGELIDFTCAEWKQSSAYEFDNSAVMIGDIRWHIEPPALIWCNKRALSRWQPVGSPEMGDAWYGPWSGEHNKTTMATVQEAIEPLKEGIAINLALVNLPERVKAIKQPEAAQWVIRSQ